MNKKLLESSKILMLIAFFISFSVTGCNSDGKQKDKDGDTEEEFQSSIDEDAQEQFQTAKRIFYSLPSPVETARILQNAGATYHEEILNPIENSNGYITNLSMALNLGIYTTDLSYASLFDQTQITLNYIEVAKKMADGLNILDAINESTIQSLEDNINNRQKIIDIISETLLNSNSYLSEKGLESTATIILVGGWVEGLFIATSLVGDDAIGDNAIVQRVVDQKLSVDFMVTLLQEATDDPDAQSVLKDVLELKTIFDKIVITQGENTIETDPETNVTTLKSNTSNNLTQEVFDELATKVNEIRNSYIS